MLKTLKYANIFTQTWNGVSVLNSSLSETGIQTLDRFLPLTSQDLTNFSSLYFLNVSVNNTKNIQKIIETKLLTLNNSSLTQLGNKTIINHNFNQNQNYDLYQKLLVDSKENNSTYLSLPSSMFYENEESFFSTDGFVKRTSKLISKKKTKNSWQIFRRFLKFFKNQVTFSNKKDNNLIFFNSKKISNYKNFITFQYYATQNLNNLNFYLNTKNKPFVFYNSHSKFKLSSSQFNNTKVKYWLDDFFIGGKDEYSHSSLVMLNCSRILRSDSTNFF